MRKNCNALLENIVDLYLSIYPELRYTQALYNLGIVEAMSDFYYEEPFDTIKRISLI